jgi:hypothetical protein
MERQKQADFDATRPVAMQLRTPAGVKIVRVRFPSDEEWTERQRKRKVIVEQLGRGISETLIPNSEEVDATLLGKIRVPDENAARSGPVRSRPGHRATQPGRGG